MANKTKQDIIILPDSHGSGPQSPNGASTDGLEDVLVPGAAKDKNTTEPRDDASTTLSVRQTGRCKSKATKEESETTETDAVVVDATVPLRSRLVLCLCVLYMPNRPPTHVLHLPLSRRLQVTCPRPLYRPTHKITLPPCRSPPRTTQTLHCPRHHLHPHPHRPSPHRARVLRH